MLIKKSILGKETQMFSAVRINVRVLYFLQSFTYKIKKDS